jgi:hypothetical protein
LRQHLFIVNPSAGRGEGRRVAGRIQHLLGERNDFKADFVYTQESGSASGIARTSSADIIVVVGGDGTINGSRTGFRERESISGSSLPDPGMISSNRSASRVGQTKPLPLFKTEDHCRSTREQSPGETAKQ